MNTDKTWTLQEISDAWDTALDDLRRQYGGYPAAPAGWVSFVRKLMETKRVAS